MPYTIICTCCYIAQMYLNKHHHLNCCWIYWMQLCKLRIYVCVFVCVYHRMCTNDFNPEKLFQEFTRIVLNLYIYIYMLCTWWVHSCSSFLIVAFISSCFFFCFFGSIFRSFHILLIAFVMMVYIFFTRFENFISLD